MSKINDDGDNDDDDDDDDDDGEVFINTHRPIRSQRTCYLPITYIFIFIHQKGGYK